jgi:hypothetical protein
MHQRFAAQDAEERIAHRPGLAQHPVHRVRFDLRLLGRHVDPASLAAQIAAVDHRDVQKRRKKLAAFQPALVLVDGPDALETRIPSQLPNSRLSNSNNARV